MDELHCPKHGVRFGYCPECLLGKPSDTFGEVSAAPSAEGVRDYTKNIHGETLPEGYRFTPEDEARLDAEDFYTHHGEVRLPPSQSAEADRFMAWRWYGQFMVPCTQEHIGAMAWRIERERELLVALTSLAAAQGEAERYLTQAYAAEGNAVYQQRRAEKAEAEVAGLREQLASHSECLPHKVQMELHEKWLEYRGILSSQLAPREVTACKLRTDGSSRCAASPCQCVAPREIAEVAWRAGYVSALEAAADDIEEESDAAIEEILKAVRGNILGLQVPPYAPQESKSDAPKGEA